jgi:hypothetical protein
MLKWWKPHRNGPVAQLGARFHGMEEVDGSNPSRSTKVSIAYRPKPRGARRIEPSPRPKQKHLILFRRCEPVPATTLWISDLWQHLSALVT